MNDYAIESFIDFCDEMQIATEKAMVEGIPVSRKKAKQVTTVDQIIELTKQEYPIILVKNKKIVDEFKNKQIRNGILTATLWMTMIGIPVSIYKMLKDKFQKYYVFRDPENMDQFFIMYIGYALND